MKVKLDISGELNVIYNDSHLKCTYNAVYTNKNKENRLNKMLYRGINNLAERKGWAKIKAMGIRKLF